MEPNGKYHQRIYWTGWKERSDVNQKLWRHYSTGPIVKPWIILAVIHSKNLQGGLEWVVGNKLCDQDYFSLFSIWDDIALIETSQHWYVADDWRSWEVIGRNEYLILHCQNLPFLGYIHCSFCLNPHIIHRDTKENVSGCFLTQCRSSLS